MIDARPIKLVRQTTRFNCGSACLAMVLGVSVEDVETYRLRRAPGELKDPKTGPGEIAEVGVFAEEMLAVLWDAGIPHLFVRFPVTGGDVYDRVCENLPAISPVDRVVGHLNAGGIAILAVNSLRTPGGGHWIVANGTRLLDPREGSDGPTYTTMAEFDQENPLDVHDAILVA